MRYVHRLFCKQGRDLPQCCQQHLKMPYLLGSRNNNHAITFAPLLLQKSETDIFRFIRGYAATRDKNERMQTNFLPTINNGTLTFFKYSLRNPVAHDTCPRLRRLAFKKIIIKMRAENFIQSFKCSERHLATLSPQGHYFLIRACIYFLI